MRNLKFIVFFLLVALGLFFAQCNLAFAKVDTIEGFNLNGNNGGIVPLLAKTTGSPSTVTFEYYDDVARVWMPIATVGPGPSGYLALWNTGTMNKIGVSIRAFDNLAPTTYATSLITVQNVMATDIYNYRNPASGITRFSAEYKTFGETQSWPPNYPLQTPTGTASGPVSGYTTIGTKTYTRMAGTLQTIRTNFTATGNSGTATIKFKAFVGTFPTLNGIKSSPNFTNSPGLQSFAVNWANVPKDAYIGFYHTYSGSYPYYMAYYNSSGDQSNEMFQTYGVIYYASGDVLTNITFNLYSNYYAGCPIEFTVSSAPPPVTQMEAGYSLDGGQTFTSTVTGTPSTIYENTFDFTWNTQDLVSDNVAIGVRCFAGTWCSWYFETGLKVQNKIFISVSNSIGYGTIDFMDYKDGIVREEPIPYTVEILYNTPYWISAPNEVFKEGVTDRKFFFKDWSDGGAQQHDAVMKWGNPTLIQANYREQVLVEIQTPYDTGNAFYGWLDINDYYRFKVNSPYVASETVRYICSGWEATGSLENGTTNDTGDFWLNNPTKLVWLWYPQYMLVISNVYGTNTGAQPGWYTHGAQIRASTTEFYALPQTARYACVGWASSGSVASGQGIDTGLFTMTSPTVVSWIWQLQYNIVVRTNHGDVSPGGSLWVIEGNLITVEASPPENTSDKQYIWGGWSAPGVPTGSGDPVFVYQVNQSGILEAEWRARYYINVITNGSFPPGAVYTGWYDEGSDVRVTAISPEPDPGVRYLLSWVADGFRMESMLPSPTTPNPAAFYALSPATINAKWVAQYSLIITDPQMAGNNMMPPVGTHWYFEGDIATGRVDFSNNEIVCLGYTGTGSVSNGTMPYFSIAINQPSTLQWLWQIRDISDAPIHNWRSPASVATNAFGTGCSLARRSSDNTPVIAYTGAPVAGSKADGKMAADSIRVGFVRNGEWVLNVLDNRGVFGSRVSLALNSLEVPYVAFIKDNDPYVSYYTASGWVTTLISAVYAAENFISIAFDEFDVPHVAFYSVSNGALMYATWNGVQWIVEVADSTANVGLFCDIEIMPILNYPSIAYYDATNGDLKFARKEAGTWVRYRVDENGNVGRNCTLALDPSGVPYIAYQVLTDSTDYGLKVAWMVPGGWEVISLSQNSIVGYDVSMVIDETGIIHISYRDFNALRYAWYDGVSWGVDKTIAGTNATGMTSVALDNEKHPSILFWDGADLKFVDTTQGAYAGPTIVTDVTAIHSGGGGGGCFVATAAFGSLASESVSALTSVRDSVVKSSECGSSLVSLYYAVSPTAADALATSSALRSLIRSMLY